MFTAERILEFEYNRDKQIESERDRLNMVTNNLSLINKARLKKINDAIDIIVSRIKRESYWDYTNEQFTYKSDFKYDEFHKDILFTINCVKREGYEYVSANNSEREKEFLREFKEPLKRLIDLEEKRAELYELARVMPIDEAIYKDKKAKIVTCDREEQAARHKEFVTIMAENFIKQYGYKCMEELVYILNKLDNTHKPISIYNVFSKCKSEMDYKRTMLIWISTYSNPGSDFIEKFYDEYYNGPAHANKPNYEEIMTNNMIRLHL